MRAITEFSNFYRNIMYIAQAGLNWADASYTMITDNPLLLGFVIMCAIVIGCALLKRLINS